MDIKVPVMPESISEGTVAKWYKKEGESVKRDEHLVDIETDKVVLEVVAPEDGVVKILKNEGQTVKAQEVIGELSESGGSEGSKEEKPKEENAKEEKPKEDKANDEKSERTSDLDALSPAVRQAIQVSGLSAEEVNSIKGSGKDGKITKEDIEKFQKSKSETSKEKAPKKEEPSKKEESSKEALKNKEQEKTTEAVQKNIKENKEPEKKQEITGERVEQRVPMTRIRAKIAERLIEAQQTAAILTSFNEINMQAVVEMRQKYKDSFEKVHGVRLGYMSFFTKAVAEALKRFPIVNASIDGNDIIYHGYIDIGIAVASPRGLVVPVLRNADTMSMAEIEKEIAHLAEKARTGKLSLEEMMGGTFTITNGGVFGSLMSTPIINPPQSAILGMHKIEERPIVENGVIVIRPMMYVALSYDHRIIDGADSVRFLVTIKEILEDTSRILLDL